MPSLKSMAQFAKHFACCYVAVAPRALYRLTLSCLLDPKGSQRFMHGCLDWRDFNCDDPVLGSTEIESLFPGGGDVVLEGPYQSSSTSETRVLKEIAVLAYLVSALKPSLIFEIGTFIGRMTRLFARNAPGAKVLTLDLPQCDVPHPIGKDYRGRADETRIMQLHGDSRTIDLTQWKGKCDFVWVDACHDYAFAKSDTLRAMELCKPGAWIAWHDYRNSAYWSGVTQTVRELRGRFDTITHIRGTTIALGKVRA